MANFSLALPIVLQHEGGISDDPNDHGGFTNLGLIKTDFETYYDRIVTDAEIAQCTEAEAQAIYKKLYWDPMLLDQCMSQNIALCLFDQGVLSGIGTATRKAQIVVGTTQDGQMGPVTMGAINGMVEAVFIKQFLGLMEYRYQEIVANDATQQKFLQGWMNRLEDLASRCGVNL